MVRVQEPVWIGHVDEGRVVFHHFFYSSVKGFVIYIQEPLPQFMPLFLYEAPLDSRSVQIQVICSVDASSRDFPLPCCHVSKCFAWCVALLVMHVKCLLCVFFEHGRTFLAEWNPAIFQTFLSI